MFILALLSSPMLSLLDSLATNFLTKDHGFFVNTLFFLVGHLSRPYLCCLITFLFAFFLWGSNLKVAACWLMITIFSIPFFVWIFGIFLSSSSILDQPDHGAFHDGFPSSGVTMSFVLIQFLFVFFISAFKKKARSRRNRFIVFLIIWLLLVFFSNIALGYSSFIESAAALLFGFFWFLLTEESYYRLAPKLKRWNIFLSSRI
ncbi:hypothetical protein ACKP2L_02125 [Oenococcus alcoholitolerans]|uniref:hypothetical protein n=1 Tax=Oenococcus alcoholitolerans TaxID=931074 RepID=UPI003F6EF846